MLFLIDASVNFSLLVLEEHALWKHSAQFLTAHFKIFVGASICFKMRSWIFSLVMIFAELCFLAESQLCRRCDQIISGRNLAYSRALEIIQEEEYLDEEEFDQIRYKRNLRVKNEFRKKHAQVFERVKRPRTKRQTEVVTDGKKAVLHLIFNVLYLAEFDIVPSLKW